MNLQVVPPLLGMDTLSQIMMLFIVGVGTYNIAGAKLWRMSGPKLPVVVIDMITSWSIANDMMIRGRKRTTSVLDHIE